MATQPLCLPIGYDDFGKVLENKLDIVDKTFFIRDVLENTTDDVILITRPRRFGKTLNMSMLRHFLAAEVTGRKTAGMFDNFKIAKECPTLMAQQGKYPVIFMTLKDIKDLNYEDAYRAITVFMSKLYLEHDYLLAGSALKEQEIDIYKQIISKSAEQAELEKSLVNLIEFLARHHGTKPWLLIDEYDTPVQSAYLHGYYEELLGFLRNFFSAALKTNPYLHKGVLTGVTRVSKESMFTGLNNVKIYSLLHSKYSHYFGFTENEVRDLLERSGLHDQSQEIRDWYNGYRFGEITIYNPWSIVNCIAEQGKTGMYWVNTSDNKLVRDLVTRSGGNFKKDIEQLLQQGSIEKSVDENIVYPDIKKSGDAAWSLFFMTGYLKITGTGGTPEEPLYQLKIPNREVQALYRKIIKEWLSNGYGVSWYNDYLKALLSGNTQELEDYLSHLLLQTISYHDAAKPAEGFYHGLLLGFTASLGLQEYELRSNQESGLGRYDIAIIPKDSRKKGVIIEIKHFKTPKNMEEVEFEKLLEQAAQEALTQIEKKQYITEFKQRGIRDVFKLGIGFSGKQCKLATN